MLLILTLFVTLIIALAKSVAAMEVSISTSITIRLRDVAYYMHQIPEVCVRG